MKRYVVGDIHGCYTELTLLLQQIHNHADGEDHKVIFVGDYVDRGPDSKNVVGLIRHMEKLGHVALMGNHEDMILSGELMYATQTLVSFNGTTLKPLPDDVMDWMRGLPKYYEDDTIIVAHAGAKPNCPMNEQTDTFLMWFRYPQSHSAFLGKHLYHGHTPFLQGPERGPDRTNVDTGCVYGGYLTAAVIGDDGNPVSFIQIKSETGVR